VQDRNVKLEDPDTDTDDDADMEEVAKLLLVADTK
jgi:hypothetical protein